jgi:hypothetical protein
VRSARCDAKGATAKVVAACVGRGSCVVTASTKFSGADPCSRTIKSLAVVATGCKGITTFGSPPSPPTAAPVFTHDVVVPLGATAEVSQRM